ncbi:MAG: hypothetical protein MZU95_14770 [Desulfomicrobium escambiense]|nr:hypothetical protein [Desulfomicrobium escambiense]
MKTLGWDGLDIILVTGDAYIDSPHIGVAVVGKALLKAGYRVGIISQPDTTSSSTTSRGSANRHLFWGITGRQHRLHGGQLHPFEEKKEIRRLHTGRAEHKTAGQGGDRLC